MSYSPIPYGQPYYPYAGAKAAVYLECLSGGKAFGNIARNVNSTDHEWKDSQVFVPYLTANTVPILSRECPTDLSKATLVTVGGFADLLRARDVWISENAPSQNVAILGGTPWAEHEVRLIRRNGPYGTAHLTFYLTPLMVGGVYWTSVITADNETLEILSKHFDPLDRNHRANKYEPDLPGLR